MPGFFTNWLEYWRPPAVCKDDGPVEALSAATSRSYYRLRQSSIDENLFDVIRKPRMRHRQISQG
jgi:hypothetical protein